MLPLPFVDCETLVRDFVLLTLLVGIILCSRIEHENHLLSLSDFWRGKKMATKCALVLLEMSFMANLGFLLKYVFSAWYLSQGELHP